MARMRNRSRGTGPRATVGREALRPYRSARACPSHAPQQPLHIKVLTDLSLLFPLMSIDIQVREDLQFILQILFILAILLQTTKKARGETTPRAQSMQARLKTAPTTQLTHPAA